MSEYLCLYLNTFLMPGPVLASTTWCQSLVVLAGNFFHLLTMRTQALQISPFLVSSNLKHPTQSSSYFLLSVNLELKHHFDNEMCNNKMHRSSFCAFPYFYLLDLALQMQHPSRDLYSFGLNELIFFNYLLPPPTSAMKMITKKLLI